MQEDDYEQQGNLLDPIKVKEGKREEIEWVLSKNSLITFLKLNARNDKVTLFVEVRFEKQGRKVRARLVVREIKKAMSEYEHLEPSDVFSAMPPVESLKAFESHVMTERVDKRGRVLDLAVFDVSKAHFLRSV